MSFNSDGFTVVHSNEGYYLATKDGQWWTWHQYDAEPCPHKDERSARWIHGAQIASKLAMMERLGWKW